MTRNTDALERLDWGDPEDLGERVPGPDSMFKVLSNPVRRRTLWYLLEISETTLDELTDVLTGWEASEMGIVGQDQRERIRLSLYHSHLPMLEKSGLVDRGDDEIRLTVESEPVRDLIRLAYRYDRASVGQTEQ